MPEQSPKQEFLRILNLVVRVLVACGLLGWSVFNLSVNVQMFLRSDESDQAWGVTIILLLVITIGPFIVGLWMLFTAVGPSKPSAKKE